MMQAGKLRHLVTIQTLTETITNGRASQSWVDGDNVYASISPMKGDEIDQERAKIGETWYRIKLRHIDLDSQSDRIKFGSTIFHIKNVINQAFRNIELELEAVTRSGD